MDDMTRMQREWKWSWTHGGGRGTRAITLAPSGSCGRRYRVSGRT